MHLSISSFTYKWSFGILGYPSAENPLDAKKLFHRACDLGVVLEQWTPYQGSVEETVVVQDRWVEKSLEYLKPIVAES
jgi:hypothetical protein